MDTGGARRDTRKKDLTNFPPKLNVKPKSSIFHEQTKIPSGLLCHRLCAAIFNLLPYIWKPSTPVTSLLLR